MSFINDIEKENIYRVKRNVNLGIIKLYKDSNVYLRKSNNRIYLYSYNKKTKSIKKFKLDYDLKYRKIFELDKIMTDKFSSSIDDIKDKYSSINIFKAINKDMFYLSLINFIFTMLFTVCNNNKYLISVSKPGNEHMFLYFSIATCVIAFLSAIISLIFIRLVREAEFEYNKLFNKKLHKFLKSI